MGRYVGKGGGRREEGEGKGERRREKGGRRREKEKGEGRGRMENGEGRTEKGEEGEGGRRARKFSIISIFSELLFEVQIFVNGTNNMTNVPVQEKEEEEEEKDERRRRSEGAMRRAEGVKISLEGDGGGSREEGRSTTRNKGPLSTSPPPSLHTSFLSFELVGLDRCVRLPHSLVLLSVPSVATTEEPAGYILVLVNNDSPACKFFFRL
jgi:hypothetical protein